MWDEKTANRADSVLRQISAGKKCPLHWANVVPVR
jgi:hypothetical protein